MRGVEAGIEPAFAARDGRAPALELHLADFPDVGFGIVAAQKPPGASEHQHGQRRALKMLPVGFGEIDVETVDIPSAFYSPALVQQRLVEGDRSFAKMVIGAGVAGDTVSDMQSRRRFEETDGDVAEPDSAELFRGNDEERDLFRIEILRRLAPAGPGPPVFLTRRGDDKNSGI